eukprot:CAMPEP_0198518140 /NCGR_PEP_ID=MMETSP1462-20131121/18947_1 /TAXON_ID=1333877 /ORGANISM="Brandtodinium nutriculum, Strain RCC3387" /LENGTH=84 /DNA_ID=CAMNT_0044247725 /DNA_START=361 /DNA_END=611 /DNA_ORIENTATION=+
MATITMPPKSQPNCATAWGMPKIPAPTTSATMMPAVNHTVFFPAYLVRADTSESESSVAATPDGLLELSEFSSEASAYPLEPGL